MTDLRAPFPYFGGKSRIAAKVWERLGSNVTNYVEPFFGSGAVLLARPDWTPAAGWIEEMDVRADGIWGRVKWTEKAKTAIHADEYRYLSPVFDHMKDGKVYRLRRAALTNTPNLELQKVAASARHNIHDEEEEDMDKVLKALGLSNDAGETGAVKAIEAMSQFITAAMKVFGLADDAKTEELLQAIQSAAGSTATLKKITDAAGIKDKEGDALVTAIQSAMSNKSDSVPDPEKYVPIGVVTELRDQLNTIQSAHSDRSAKEAVAKAMEDGQITPAQETWALALHKQNPKSFEDFISGAPKLTQSQLSQTRKPGDPGAGLTDSDKAVMSQLGIAQDKFLETRKAEQA